MEQSPLNSLFSEDSTFTDSDEDLAEELHEFFRFVIWKDISGEEEEEESTFIEDAEREGSISAMDVFADFDDTKLKKLKEYFTTNLIQSKEKSMDDIIQELEDHFTFRLVVDFRKLNKRVIPDPYPLPATRNQGADDEVKCLKLDRLLKNHRLLGWKKKKGKFHWFLILLLKIQRFLNLLVIKRISSCGSRILTLVWRIEYNSFVKCCILLGKFYFSKFFKSHNWFSEVQLRSILRRKDYKLPVLKSMERFETWWVCTERLCVP